MKKWQALLFLSTSILAVGANSEITAAQLEKMTPEVRAIVENYRKENEELKKALTSTEKTPEQTETIEMYKTENEQLKKALEGRVRIVGESEAGDVKIQEGVKNDGWVFSSRTYIEREDYSSPGGNDFGETEDIMMLGVGVSAVKGRWGYHLNTEQRGTGHLNSDGADNQNTRNDYKVRYQLTDEMGVHFKYRSERGNKKRDAYAAEQNRNRDRFELGTDFNFFDGNWSGWLVGGRDIDSQKVSNESDNKNKGYYYEGDMGPTFPINDKLALRPTIYSTGEFYDDNDETMLEHQLRLMAIYKATDKLVIMPRIRYTLTRTLEEDSYTYRYDSDYRVRAELLFDYKVNETYSVDMGVAYDWQDRSYEYKDGNGNRYDEVKGIDMLWYTLGLTYRF